MFSFSILSFNALSYFSTNCFNVVFEFTYPSKNEFILSLRCVVDIPAQNVSLTNTGTQRSLSSNNPFNHTLSCSSYSLIILLVLVAHWRFCRVATRVISQLRELRLAAASMKHQGGATGSSRSCEGSSPAAAIRSSHLRDI